MMMKRKRKKVVANVIFRLTTEETGRVGKYNTYMHIALQRSTNVVLGCIMPYKLQHNTYFHGEQQDGKLPGMHMPHHK